MKVLSSGAEATIYHYTDEYVEKRRAEKSYRVPELDASIIKFRTKREAKILSKLNGMIPVPAVREETHSSSNNSSIFLEFIDGKKVSDILSRSNYSFLFRKIGEYVARMHDEGIIHGDLTTSNFIYSEAKKEVFFIDFGLSFFSIKVEDKAVDIHLLRQALESKHPDVWEMAFNIFRDIYMKSSNNSKETLSRFKQVEERGRNKKK